MVLDNTLDDILMQATFANSTIGGVIPLVPQVVDIGDRHAVGAVVRRALG